MPTTLNKWKISLISTDHDLHELRIAVKKLIIKAGFQVVAFEETDYPVPSGVHSHDACLSALNDVDIVILLIDKRYGSFYVGNTNISITEEEYIKSFNSNKIIIPCINNKAEQARYASFDIVNQLVKNGTYSSVLEARENIVPNYVEKWDVFDFIEDVRKAYKDNFVIGYNDSNDLIPNIEGRLRGLSSSITYKIVEKQLEKVQSMRHTTFPFSYWDIINSGLFIEPPCNFISGTPHDSTSFLDLCTLSNHDDKILILGTAGIGKSTALIYSYISHSKSVAKGDTRFPLFLSLRGRGPKYHFDIEKYIDECMEFYLKKEPFPNFNHGCLQYVFYIDGFDEIAEQSSFMDLDKAINSYFFDASFVLTSRTRFAEESLQRSKFAEKVNKIIELQPWKKDRIWKYIDTFCQKSGNNTLYDTMYGAYYNDDEMLELFRNPLLLNMFLWIVDDNEMKLPLVIKDQVSLYEAFIDRWLTRELDRIGTEIGQSKGAEVKNEILVAWELSAWEIYKNRFSDELIHINQLKEKLAHHGIDVEKIFNSPAFLGLLDINKYTDYVLGMFHEQFMEHLMAKSVVNSTINHNYIFPEYLSYVIRYEINQIIKPLWKKELTSNINKMFENLKNIYEQTIDLDDENSISIRNHTIYYLGRLIHEGVQPLLLVYYNNEKCIHVKISIAFGLIKLENLKIEENFLENLKNNDEWDKTNRGYHLVYYGDWAIKDERPPYLDQGKESWNNTLKALTRHLVSDNPKHMYLRRIELFTLKRLIEVRKNNGPMTKDIMDEIEKAIRSNKTASTEFDALVLKEYEELKSVFTLHNS